MAPIPAPGGRQRGGRPAQCPRQREPEQQVGQHEVGRHADEHPGGQSRGRPAAPAVRPHQGQPEQARGGRQHVEVTARDQRPEHERVHRPEQVGPGPARGVGAEQPVQPGRHAQERQSVPRLEPGDDRHRRGAAEPGGRPLLGGGERAVQRGVPAPGQPGQVADRVAGLLQLVGGHHVGVVAEQGHPPVGGIADGVRGARGGQHRERRDRADGHRDQQPGGIPRAARHGGQPGGHAAPAEDRRRP